ncbi:root meristem growth factor 10 [Juglans microcarpa x Juglans regia]|uniref:root meristem growth factor 10 n=1 Tax=Juglans microcarpa x Juglans regia TaxID=2249226 RepID=UPI001B7EC2AB|nr:root meristem growth factor 10 [Juglans microcarpa x Juglans regia]
MSLHSCLLLFLLCLSLHACNARHFRAVDNNLEKKITHFSNENDEKMGFEYEISALSNVKSSPAKQHGEAKRGSIAVNPSNDSTTDQKRKETTTNQKVPRVEGKTPVSVQTESLASVSWRVPHKKPSEKNPGFNLDYSPPKTHPPSHN